MGVLLFITVVNRTQTVGVATHSAVEDQQHFILIGPDIIVPNLGLHALNRNIDPNLFQVQFDNFGCLDVVT